MGSCTNSNYVAQQGLPGDFSPSAASSCWKRRSPAPRPCYKYHVGNISSGDTLRRGPASRQDLGRDGRAGGRDGIRRPYTNAAAAGVNALCIVTISDGPEEITTAEERQTAFTQMMEVALSLA